MPVTSRISDVTYPTGHVPRAVQGATPHLAVRVERRDGQEVRLRCRHASGDSVKPGESMATRDTTWQATGDVIS